MNYVKIELALIIINIIKTNQREAFIAFNSNKNTYNYFDKQRSTYLYLYMQISSPNKKLFTSTEIMKSII